MKNPAHAERMRQYWAAQEGESRKRTQRRRWDKPTVVVTDEKAEEVWRQHEDPDYAERCRREFDDPGRRKR
jgi:hypothetical protein